MTNLPVRTLNNTATEHLADHNTIHPYVNGETYDESIYYVHKGGSNSNDGLSKGTAKLDPQSAVDALAAAQKPGRIMLGSGRFDVGASGIQVDRRYPIEFIGLKPKHGFASPTGVQYPSGQTVFYTSNASLTELVSTVIPVGSPPNAYGFTFQGIGFEMRSTVNRAIYGYNLNDVIVRDCGFWSDGNPNAWGLEGDHGNGGDDHSWWRIEDNWVGNCGLFYGHGGQNNQHVIVGNKGIGASTSGTLNVTANPFIRLEDANRCFVAGNNVEWYKSLTYGGIYLAGDSTGCVGNEFIANGGEGNDYFYVVQNSKNNLFTGMGTSAAGTTATSRFIWFKETSSNRCRDNMVMLYVGGSAYAYGADIVVDDTANKLNYWQVSHASDPDFKREHLPYRYVDAGLPSSNATMPNAPLGAIYQRTDGTTDSNTNLYVRKLVGSVATWVAIA